MLIGEAPCTKDLITVTDRTSRWSTRSPSRLVFLIILLVLKSISLPFILVAVIELAIFINLGIPYYTGTLAALHRADLHQHHSAGRDRRLRHSDDDPLQEGALWADRKSGRPSPMR
jgi:hypothetical protein